MSGFTGALISVYWLGEPSPAWCFIKVPEPPRDTTFKRGTAAALFTPRGRAEVKGTRESGLPLQEVTQSKGEETTGQLAFMPMLIM